jgi:hypothetical protein
VNVWLRPPPSDHDWNAQVSSASVWGDGALRLTAPFTMKVFV